LNTFGQYHEKVKKSVAEGVQRVEDLFDQMKKLLIVVLDRLVIFSGSLTKQVCEQMVGNMAVGQDQVTLLAPSVTVCIYLKTCGQLVA
jgi:hypothetical protein